MCQKNRPAKIQGGYSRAGSLFLCTNAQFFSRVHATLVSSPGTKDMTMKYFYSELNIIYVNLFSCILYIFFSSTCTFFCSLVFGIMLKLPCCHWIDCKCFFRNMTILVTFNSTVDSGDHLETTEVLVFIKSHQLSFFVTLIHVTIPASKDL
jgi:hypothetical protein